ncbi:MAG: Aminomethyltransferase folate-binding domain [Actinomycetota bacterium]|jgi:glycine cleavage system aminomethyltransferase T|nr:Aminomethyltransferase folate-binding domain [Actinomycetota bacterium]
MPSQELSAALESGKAFVDLSSWRKVDVSGPGALEWLSELGSANVTDLAPGRARRTVLPAEGGIRTEATVALAGPNIVVIQDSAANPSALDILEAATGSGTVAVRDRSEAMSLFSFPGATVAPDVAGTAFSAPSCVGAGVDVFALGEDHDYLLGSLQHGFLLVTLSDVRTWLEQTSEGS